MGRKRYRMVDRREEEGRKLPADVLEEAQIDPLELAKALAKRQAEVDAKRNAPPVRVAVVRMVDETEKAIRYILPSGYRVWIPRSAVLGVEPGYLTVPRYIANKPEFRFKPTGTPVGVCKAEARDKILAARSK